MVLVGGTLLVFSIVFLMLEVSGVYRTPEPHRRRFVIYCVCVGIVGAAALTIGLIR